VGNSSSSKQADIPTLLHEYNKLRPAVEQYKKYMAAKKEVGLPPDTKCSD